MNIKIAHLYPDMLNLYGDSGNILALKYRLNARGIEADVVSYSIDEDIDFSSCDIVLIGGGGEREQKSVCNRLREMREDLIAYAEDGGVILAVCGGLEVLGKYYKTERETIEGVGLLDIATCYGKDKIIGNVVTESEIAGTIVGFENHSGMVDIGGHTPLGKVISGKGNDGKGFDGVIYKNVIATYLHGPLLPKNPRLADYIIAKAIERRYGETELSPLDDTIEMAAHDYMIGRFSVK